MEGKTDDSSATNEENEIQCINSERYDDTNERQHFLLPNVNSRTPKIAVEYIRRPDMSRYNPALKNLIPIRREKEDKDSMPADSAGLFSYVFYTWITPYIWKAYETGISIQDIPRISSYETCKYNAQRLEVLWQEELNERGPHSASFSIVAWRFVRTRICIAWFLLICSTICGFISPMILMRKVLEHVQSPEEDSWVGIKWALLLTCCDFLRMVFFTWTWNTNIRTALRLKSACTTLLYKKLMRLNNLGNKSTGELTNLFTNDSQRLFDVIIYGPMIISGPIIITCGVVYILWLFSPLALFGTFIFLIFYPCQYLISRIVGRFRSKTVVITDVRVKLMNEILECIKLIKMCSWEKYFSNKLLAIRKKEEHWLHKTVYFQSFAISLTPAVPVISAIVTFLAHLSSGGNLTAAQAFPLTTFFGNMLRMALVSIKDSTRYFIDARIALSRFKVFPLVSLLNSQFRSSFMFLQVALVNIAESKIVFNRLQSVLLLEEFTCYLSKPIVKSQAIAITNGTFVYENLTICANESKNIENKKILSNVKNKVELEKLNEISNETQYVKVLADIKFGAAKGALIGICGHVGSGKSSLLLAALGQLRLTRGHVLREGSCAYVSQQAWIVNATLKENILFGSQFDAKRYYQALTVCNLKEDINMLPGGDETEIGERGVNLSGGQKQRVALARALYANRDIYFLDDPLSAVDAHVGSYIFKNLILGALKDKCVLFVTHQVQFLKHCDQIYLMKNGKIVEQGTHDELIQLKKEYVTMVNSALLETHGDTKEMSTVAQIKNSNSGSDLKVQIVGCNFADNPENGEASMRINREGSALTTEEKIETGTVKLHTYHMYIKAAGGYIVAIVVFFTLFLNVGSSAFSSWWLATWIKAGGGNVTNPVTNETIVSNNLNDNPDFAYYQNIYGACIGAILFTSLLRGLVITFTTINASTTLHNKVFKKMIESSLTFFETTPSGRIQNIFSRDIDEVDSYIPISVENMVQNIFTCSFAIIFICSILPWFSIPLIILAAIFFYTSKVFRVAMRDLKRMESASRSPVLSFVTTTVHGLNTIHAFQKEKAFTNKFEELFDLNNLCLYLCQSAMRWSAVRLDSLAIASASITAFLVIAIRDQISPALAGLAMAYSMQMTGVFQYTVRLMAETETRFISVERICYYLRTLRNEETLGKDAENPPNEWPTHGKLEFHEVQLRYRKELPLILNNISFTIKAGEHIGIVGRTGAGKSSLIVALFRLVEACAGKIKIDGVDIAKVSLELLRSKLSIIPQDPVLFSGSIRSNLDPFNKHSDLDLWSALEKTRLKEKVILMSGQLDAFVEVGGNNMSVGERQLLCLTRALLRNTKVMILDEATAAVDPETEVAVQNTIQNEFSHCTVLTIAHRLKTVVSCDRVIVMKNGQIIEFDAPSVLMSNPNSEFTKMIASADKVVKDV
ncbi:ATP-binding cassette sub-family C member 5-like isoform X1 [Hylaeus volcanicus]|uniref:ATP-binding cassette sub-family C member 5-like isoform X1 n=2 Tax=Hylaeus volcanicus TaxID=313075 RepID=UPI0023B780BE|nr:ATP-binding cassette sub-family C member 5-like isoform X1 [Hylaeus volcanicus]XP_053972250.1 ATP-binding cassette sub-family C member 5-like isoform X1 [Hylaeus volcanicus]